jgi:hypothetical protein
LPLLANLGSGARPRPRGNRLSAPMTMAWRAANGEIIKTFNML